MKADYLNGTEYTLEQPEEMYHFNSDTELLGRFMRLRRSDRVLDIGCNTGALLLYAAHQKAQDLTGIDLFDSVLRQAEKRNVLLPDDVFSDPRKAEAIESRDALFAYYLNAVRGCGAGVTEIFLHPRVSEAGPGSPWRKRRWEYDLLLSGALIREAKACGVQVVGPAQCYR